MTIKQIRKAVNETTARSAWDRGVKDYALELLDNLEEWIKYNDSIKLEEHTNNYKDFKHFMLNGAQDWESYSLSGNSLIYDCDIAKRLCTPSELKRTKGGELNPNKREDWLQCQARALTQAGLLLYRVIAEDPYKISLN